MGIRYWLGILLAVPLTYGQQLQETSVTARTISPEQYAGIIAQIPSCAVCDEIARRTLNPVAVDN
jgi:hypothetical protein